MRQCSMQVGTPVCPENILVTEQLQPAKYRESMSANVE